MPWIRCSNTPKISHEKLQQHRKGDSKNEWKKAREIPVKNPTRKTRSLFIYSFPSSQATPKCFANRNKNKKVIIKHLSFFLRRREKIQ